MAIFLLCKVCNQLKARSFPLIPELGFIDITRRRGLVLQEYSWFVNGLSN